MHTHVKGGFTNTGLSWSLNQIQRYQGHGLNPEGETRVKASYPGTTSLLHFPVPFHIRVESLTFWVFFGGAQPQIRVPMGAFVFINTASRKHLWYKKACFGTLSSPSNKLTFSRIAEVGIEIRKTFHTKGTVHKGWEVGKSKSQGAVHCFIYLDYWLDNELWMIEYRTRLEMATETSPLRDPSA